MTTPLLVRRVLFGAAFRLRHLHLFPAALEERAFKWYVGVSREAVNRAVDKVLGPLLPDRS